MRKFRVGGALKSGNSERIKFRAAQEMTAGYFSRALADLIGMHVAIEVPLE